MNKSNFNIIGAGAMGHLWTSFLAKTSFPVTLYARKQQTRSISVESSLSCFTQTINYQQLSNWTDADVTIICVKAHQLENLCTEMKALAISPKVILLIMNGMGLVSIVESHLPESKVLHASTVHGAYLNKDKLIHTGKGKTLIGNLDGHHTVEEFQTIIEQLNSALPLVYWNEAHQQTMNLKLVINAVINPLTAISKKTNGSILHQEQLNNEAMKLLVELKPLLKQLLPKFTFTQIKREVERVAKDTQNNISSMLQDVRAGKMTEIKFINGYLVDLALKESLNLPEHTKIINNINRLL